MSERPSTRQLPFELRHLRSFAVLADTLNFHAAAELLHLAQPALTKQIRDLEGSLNVRLFHRDGRGTVLSAAGEQFLPYAWSVLRAADEAARAVQQRTWDAKVIRLGVTEIVMNSGFRRFLSASRQGEPNLSVFLETECTEGLLRLLTKGRIDTALVHLPVSREGVTVEALYSEPLVLAGPRSAQHLDETGRRGLPVIMFPYESGPTLYTAIYEALTNHLDSFFVIHESEGFASRLLMAEAGLGYSVVPKAMVEENPSVALLDIPGLPRLETGIAVPHRPVSNELASFVERLKLHYAA